MICFRVSIEQGFYRKWQDLLTRHIYEYTGFVSIEYTGCLNARKWLSWNCKTFIKTNQMTKNVLKKFYKSLGSSPKSKPSQVWDLGLTIKIHEKIVFASVTMITQCSSSRTYWGSSLPWHSGAAIMGDYRASNPRHCPKTKVFICQDTV